MWLTAATKGEFDVAIGGVVKLSDSGQIAIVDDEGNVSCYFFDAFTPVYYQNSGF